MFVADDQFYADSYGSGLLLRGVLYRFLKQYEKAHENFDEILQMPREFDERSFIPPTALVEKAMIYIDLKDKDKANEYLQRSM